MNRVIHSYTLEYNKHTKVDIPNQRVKNSPAMNCVLQVRERRIEDLSKQTAAAPVQLIES